MLADNHSLLPPEIFHRIQPAVLQTSPQPCQESRIRLENPIFREKNYFLQSQLSSFDLSHLIWRQIYKILSQDEMGD